MRPDEDERKNVAVYTTFPHWRSATFGDHMVDESALRRLIAEVQSIPGSSHCKDLSGTHIVRYAAI
eukprot:scaffold276452_cov36-Tisochrysis_lutea.AAC.1